MKQIKRILCLLLSAITITLSASISVFANEEVHVILDGELMSFDVPAQIINDRTMVPMRPDLFGVDSVSKSRDGF